MRRGELRAYVRPSTPGHRRTVVLLSSDGINDSPRPWLLGIELRDTDPGERVGALDRTRLARLDGALRAALDL